MSRAGLLRGMRAWNAYVHRALLLTHASAASLSHLQIILQVEVDTVAQTVLRARFPGVRLLRDGAWADLGSSCEREG